MLNTVHLIKYLFSQHLAEKLFLLSKHYVNCNIEKENAYTYTRKCVVLSDLHFANCAYFNHMCIMLMLLYCIEGSGHAVIIRNYTRPIKNTKNNISMINS
jgi:hypothetical protein